MESTCMWTQNLEDANAKIHTLESELKQSKKVHSAYIQMLELAQAQDELKRVSDRETQCQAQLSDAEGKIRQVSGANDALHSVPALRTQHSYRWTVRELHTDNNLALTHSRYKDVCHDIVHAQSTPLLDRNIKFAT